MSTLRVGTITDLAGTGSPYQKGSVVQVQYYQSIDNASFNLSSQRNADNTIPNFQVVITPASTNSIIKLDAQFSFGFSGNNYDMVFGFFRDSTKLANSGSDLSASSLVPPGSYNTRRRGVVSPTSNLQGNNTFSMNQAYFTYFDTPATTSPVTYTVYIQSYDPNTTVYINSAANANSIGSESGISWISATEIGV